MEADNEAVRGEGSWSPGFGFQADDWDGVMTGSSGFHCGQLLGQLLQPHFAALGGGG